MLTILMKNKTPLRSGGEDILTLQLSLYTLCVCVCVCVCVCTVHSLLIFIIIDLIEYCYYYDAKCVYTLWIDIWEVDYNVCMDTSDTSFNCRKCHNNKP